MGKMGKMSVGGGVNERDAEAFDFHTGIVEIDLGADALREHVVVPQVVTVVELCGTCLQDPCRCDVDAADAQGEVARRACRHVWDWSDAFWWLPPRCRQ